MSEIKMSETKMHATNMSETAMSKTGLPDFYWYNIPKWGKDIPNNHKIYRMASKYAKWP
jgi:hypothetical protein